MKHSLMWCTARSATFLVWTTPVSRWFLAAAMTFALVGVARAAPDTVRVYGPGGPLPAVKEAAETFGKARGIDVQVTAGPTPGWIDKAKQDAERAHLQSFIDRFKAKASKARQAQSRMKALEKMKPISVREASKCSTSEVL
mgnify:CR=1 FL=1